MDKDYKVLENLLCDKCNNILDMKYSNINKIIECVYCNIKRYFIKVELFKNNPHIIVKFKNRIFEYETSRYIRNIKNILFTVKDLIIDTHNDIINYIDYIYDERNEYKLNEDLFMGLHYNVKDDFIKIYGSKDEQYLQKIILLEYRDILIYINEFIKGNSSLNYEIEKLNLKFTDSEIRTLYFFDKFFEHGEKVNKPIIINDWTWNQHSRNCSWGSCKDY